MFSLSASMKNMSKASPRSANRRQRVQRGADDDLDAVGDTGPLEVLARHLRVPWFEFERDDAAVGPDAAGQVDGAVAGQRADLQHPLRVRHPRQERQQPAVLSRHLDGRHVSRSGGFPRCAQRVVLGVQHPVEHLVKGFGVRLRHAADVTASAHPPWRRRPAARGRPPVPSPGPASSQNVATNSGPCGGLRLPASGGGRSRAARPVPAAPSRRSAAPGTAIVARRRRHFVVRGAWPRAVARTVNGAGAGPARAARPGSASTSST